MVVVVVVLVVDWDVVVVVVVRDVMGVVVVVLFQLLLEEVRGRGENKFVSPDPIPSGEQGDVGEEVPVGPEIVFEVGIGRSGSKDEVRIGKVRPKIRLIKVRLGNDLSEVLTQGPFKKCVFK